MEKTADSLFWLRTVAYVAVAGVALGLILEGTPFLPWVLVGLAVFAVLLPMWPWARKLGAVGFFGVVLVEAALVSVGQFVSGHPGTVMSLYLVVLPICARLPRRFSLLCYTGFPLLACLPHLLGPDARMGWSVVAEVTPGFLASIAFSEGYWAYRDALRAKEVLLDELVRAQRLQVPDEPVEAVAKEGLTRRDREVLSLVALGYSNKEIAERLFLAEGTVKNRVSQILEKIGARDRTQAALRARERGLV